jgi:hypothetical protein
MIVATLNLAGALTIDQLNPFAPIQKVYLIDKKFEFPFAGDGRQYRITGPGRSVNLKDRRISK